MVGEIYENGIWRVLDNSSSLKYDGEIINQSVIKYVAVSPIGFQIIPIVSIGGFIPSISNPLVLKVLENKISLSYYPDQQIFFTEDKIDGVYNVIYMSYLFDESILLTASTSNDSRYMDIPSYMLSTIRSLALNITEKYGAKTTYEKLKAIENFLKTNYKYDKNYTAPPEGFDPVLYFLFNEKRGICVHFNSAFVLLARSLGIPARLVGGYLIDPKLNYQVVTYLQAHAYAEVLFEGLGWITFDATPAPSTAPSSGICKGCKKSTITEVTNLDNIGIKGLPFRVLGTVLDEHGSKISGLKVKVYLKHNKSENDLGIIVGTGFVENGLFNITCIAPLDIDIGEYYVIAHAITNDRYMGSWSDPQIKIMAKTYISTKVPDRVIAGRTFIASGTLKEEADIPIANKTVTLIIGSKIYSAVTDRDGVFFINCSIREPGNYTLLFNFAGSEYYLNSMCNKTLRVLALGITPMTKSIFIRDDDVHISGWVHAEDLAGDHEEVLISLDEINVTKVKADSNGYFNITFHVPSNCTLGRSILKYLLLCNGHYVFQEISIMARTQIIAFTPQLPVESNKLFNITAILKDDLQQPVQGVIIFLNYSCQNQNFSANSTTNENGTALFNVKLSVSKEEKASYLITFPGNEIYLGTQISGHISVVPVSGAFIYEFHLLLVLALANPLFAYFLYKVGWIKRKKTKPFEESSKAKEVVAPVIPIVTKKDVKLTITFTDIKEPFPFVWGINEKLAVCLEIKENDGTPIAEALLKLSINNKENICLSSSQNGDVKTYLTFTEKGNYKLEAYFAGDDKRKEAAAEANIVIVDYKEEIVNLFNSFLESVSKAYQGLDKNMTAREIQFKLASQIPDSKHMYLEDLVSIFEVADYSLHTITRREYEKMFLAKLNLER
ncbi:MAG: transglutaminase domain-containing protein [Nitrososphaeria archaeon]